MNPPFDLEYPTDFCTVRDGGSAPPGMDCQRTPPFHYHHIHESTKSLLALQELQQEVGALLEFRDVVMDTFPGLRQKLEPTHHAAAQWEPGVKVKRKIVPKTTDGISGVQDSGFSTETSSSNKNEAEDELWNLLDLIETKGTKLRAEVEALKKEQFFQDCPRFPPRRCRSLDSLPEPPEPFPLNLDDLENLLDKLTRLESENAASRVRTTELQSEMTALLSAKEELEEQLQVVLGQKGELNRCVQQLLRGEVSSSQGRGRRALGALDGVVSEPRRLAGMLKMGKPDRRKVEAILKEKYPLELQRHLIVSVAENQALNLSLETSRKEKEGLAQMLEKSKEENEELKFRLEERAIELEGTKAQVRVLERFQKPKREDNNFTFLEDDNLRSKGFSEIEISRAREIFESKSANNVLPILALPLAGMSESESMDTAKISPRRRPSRIPLSNPNLRKSLGDIQKDLTISSPKPPSTTTVTMTFKKVTPPSQNQSSPSLKPVTQFSTVRSRDTLSRRCQSSDANRSLRSHSESGRSLRSRDSLTLVRRDTTPTKPTPSAKPAKVASTDGVKTNIPINTKTPLSRRRRVFKSPPPSSHFDQSLSEDATNAKGGGIITQGSGPDGQEPSVVTQGSGIVTEAKRGFHRRIAEKLALNFSGVRQKFWDSSNSGTGFNMWSSSKQEAHHGSGHQHVNSETRFFDSIDSVQQHSIIVQSCSFMNDVPQSPDSLEPSPHH